MCFRVRSLNINDGKFEVMLLSFIIKKKLNCANDTYYLKLCARVQNICGEVGQSNSRQTRHIYVIGLFVNFD